jgi:F0F1-type ATP synthase assembly protein I
MNLELIVKSVIGFTCGVLVYTFMGYTPASLFVCLILGVLLGVS